MTSKAGLQAAVVSPAMRRRAAAPSFVQPVDEADFVGAALLDGDRPAVRAGKSMVERGAAM